MVGSSSPGTGERGAGRTRPLLGMGAPALLGVLLLLLVALPPAGGSFWFDEVFTANLVTFRLTPERVVERVAREDAHPPGFYLLAWAYARATGLWGSAVEGPPPHVEERLRLLSVLTGAVATGLVGAYGGAAGALALAASPAFLEKAGEARMYPLLALFWTLAYVGVLRNRPSLAAWAGLGALYTHYLAPFFLLPLYGAMALRLGPGSLLRLWPFLLYLPWVPVFLNQLKGGMSMALARPDPVLALEPLYRLGNPEALGLLLLGVVLYGAVKRRKEDGLLLLLPFLAVLLWWAGSLWVNTVSLRYVGAFLPPMALALGLAVRELSPASRGLLLLGLALAYAALLWDRPGPPGEGYREKAAILQSLEEHHGPFVVLGDERGRLISLRYYWRSASTLRPITEEDLKDPPFQKGILVLLQYPGWKSEDQVLMGRLLDRAREEGRLRILHREGVFLYLWEK